MSFYQFMSWFFIFLSKNVFDTTPDNLRSFVREAYREGRLFYKRSSAVATTAETFFIPGASLQAMLYITDNGEAMQRFVYMYNKGVPAVAAAAAANYLVSLNDTGYENYFQVHPDGIFYVTTTWATHLEITSGGVTLARKSESGQYGDLGLWKWDSCGKLLSASRSDVDWRWEDGLKEILPLCLSVEDAEAKMWQEEEEKLKCRRARKARRRAR